MIPVFIPAIILAQLRVPFRDLGTRSLPLLRD